MPQTPVAERKIVLTPGDDDRMRLSHIIQVSPLVPEGEMFHFSSRLTGGTPEVLVAPNTYFAMTHGGLWPLESRYTRGNLELEKERRRRRREGGTDGG